MRVQAKRGSSCKVGICFIFIIGLFVIYDGYLSNTLDKGIVTENPPTERQEPFITRPSPIETPVEEKPDFNKGINIIKKPHAKDWKNSKDKPLISFVTCPKKFPSKSQLLGLLTWLTLDPQPEIIYISDDPGVEEVAKEYGIRHIGNVKRNSYGTPTLDFIFSKAQEEANGEIIVFLNTDILTMQNFMDVLTFVVKASRLLDNLLVVGPRQDTDLEEEFYNWDSTWHERFEKKHMNKGLWTSSTALDYFIFKKGYFPKFPPMAIGRFVWDTWIMSYALKTNWPAINGKDSIQAFHVNHHYEIKGLPGARDSLNNAPLESKKGSPEFVENLRLGDEYGGIGGGELQCAEYSIATCRGNNFCLVLNKKEMNTEYCKHDNWLKISDAKLEAINKIDNGKNKKE